MKAFMDDKNFKKLCIKVVSGNGSEDDKSNLEKYIQSSTYYAEEFNGVKELWKNCHSTIEVDIPNIEQEWELLANRINHENNSQATKQSIGIIDSVHRIFRFKYAIQICIVLFVVIGLYSFLNTDKSGIKNINVSTGNGQHETVYLPDGSTVLMNSGSSLQYPEQFIDAERIVSLSGEAFFSIKKDVHPFIVVTENASTKVLGTKFNVWTRGSVTRVFVKEGLVNLKGSNAQTQGVNIGRNQQSSVKEKLAPDSPEKIDSDYLLGWTEGKIVFSENSLSEVADELSRSYNVNIQLSEDIYQPSTLTGSFKNMTIDSVLTVICETMNLEFENNANGYIIKNHSMEKK